ncbi:ornithine carbamoyltransferase, catabolic [Leifsonia sp. LS1]|uniref:ornithine carbamoyltransferase n=1 Tax=Leifsonia sp. LS1 TaxID=2828483 RepID=UPI001CFCCDB0|nr:ornithine carbamoyltransferase [Leifsonia sp. LS1]GIT78394.1 ornithine carbamoyltransferase, catabolic [Leifsonia sp. LS1]
MTITPQATVPHLLKDSDLTPARILRLLDLAADLKQHHRSGTERQELSGRAFALIFEKPSTRTRSAFEIAAYQQGGTSTYIDSHSSHLGDTESVADTAQVLSRLYDGIAYRGYQQSRAESLAAAAAVPVFNALTDRWHPTQALADLLTIREHSLRPLSASSVCFAGDGNDNVAASLLVSGASLGVDVRIAAPEPLWPDADTLREANERADAVGGRRPTVTTDLREATAGVDFIYTDVWVSMGEPEGIWGDRVHQLLPYRVDRAVMEGTGNPATKFLHCLPSIHDGSTRVGARIADEFELVGAEVSDDVFRSSRSLVFDQAENRMHTIKAVLVDAARRVRGIG